MDSDLLLGHLVFAMVIGLMLAALIGATLRDRRGSGAVGLTVIALVLGVWAGGLWLPSIGPTVMGIHPVPFLLAGLALAFAFAILVLNGRRRPAAIQGPRELPRILAADPGPIAMGMWFLVLMLIGAIAYRYASG